MIRDALIAIVALYCAAAFLRQLVHELWLSSPRPPRTPLCERRCPHCGAGVGEPCQGVGSQIAAQLERARWDAYGRHVKGL